MAFYNCNGISSSGGNGGGISSLGKIEEYGYTLSEAKDVFKLSANSFNIVSMNDKYILYYAYVDGASKYFKLDRENWSTTEVTDIPKTVSYGNKTYSLYLFGKYNTFDVRGDMILLYKYDMGSSSYTYAVYKYNGNTLSLIGYTADYMYNIYKITDDYIYEINSSTARLYDYKDLTKIAIGYSITNGTNPGVYINDDIIGSGVIYSNYRPLYTILKISEMGISKKYIEFGTRSDISTTDFHTSFLVDHYIYLPTINGVYRVNFKENTFKFNYKTFISSNNIFCFYDGHILYDIRLDSTSKIYTIHKHADVVNKLTLYLKEGNEIFCDTNVLHPITSNLIKSVNGYKCTSNGKCELWFREDPEELTYSII